MKPTQVVRFYCSHGRMVWNIKWIPYNHIHISRTKYKNLVFTGNCHWDSDLPHNLRKLNMRQMTSSFIVVSECFKLEKANTHKIIFSHIRIDCLFIYTFCYILNWKTLNCNIFLIIVIADCLGGRNTKWPSLLENNRLIQVF